MTKDHIVEMEEHINKYISKEFGINPKLISLSYEIERELALDFHKLDQIAMLNQGKVLKAFQQVGVSDMHFGWNTGYGYDDAGREAVEKVFAKVFDAEKALVRPNIVNGTHAISLALLGLLKKGDKLIYCTGAPYDTLQSVTGYKESGNADEDKKYTGTLKDMGVEYEEISLLSDGNIDSESVINALTDNVRMIAIQRSKGYSWRNTITTPQIESFIKTIRENKIGRHIIIMVDNCYTEFCEELNPISVGADIICGSLIKNPGGGLALSGGYLCGREDLIDIISYRLTCPGIGAECGLTFGQNRGVLQGLFQAPRVTIDAVKGAMLCGKLFKILGFDICPDFTEIPNIEIPRSDIIQAVKLKSPEAVQAFCSGIQAAAPIDSNVTPVPAPMPGYDDDIIMAAGTFVQGSSIELSADGPLRDPYIVYFQGGLTYEHSKIGVLKAAQSLIDTGIINLQ